jgi:hypothetical protein
VSLLRCRPDPADAGPPCVDGSGWGRASLNLKSYVDLPTRSRALVSEPYSFRALFADLPTSSGGLWVGSRRPFADVLDVKNHHRVWQLVLRRRGDEEWAARC